MSGVASRIGEGAELAEYTYDWFKGRHPARLLNSLGRWLVFIVVGKEVGGMVFCSLLWVGAGDVAVRASRGKLPKFFVL